jgi:cation diffusion facilitator CzcD-associated flavoprotein CzcO
MGIRLKKAGIESFTIYEKAEDLGGTWRDNTYPGAACDVPSHVYSYSFEPNPAFTRKYSGQAEIRAYLMGVAERHGLLPHLRFGMEATAARFDEDARLWRVSFLGHPEVSSDVVITGLGQLNRPAVPRFSGLDSFEGTVAHSARFGKGVEVRGRRVGVVGSGASAIQIIPQVAKDAERLTVFQRTPNWIVSRRDRAYSSLEKWFFRHVPATLKAYRSAMYLQLDSRFFALTTDAPFRPMLEKMALRHLESQVARPELREALTPEYPIGCKRILISDDFYPALQLPNVELVTDAIAGFEPGGIRTKAGVFHPLDAVIFATGFETTSFLAPMAVHGRGGSSLAEAWKDGAEAYFGVAVADFPNLFMLYGPNTNLGHNSIIFMLECQVAYIARCIERLSEYGLATLEVRRDAMDRYNAHIAEELSQTIWSAGCDSWYKTASGKITNNWSTFTSAYWWRTRHVDWSAFKGESA